LANGTTLMTGLALLAMTPAAFAQDAAGLAKTIGQGVRCLEDRAFDDLAEMLVRVGENDQAIVLDALTLLGADPAVCEPLRAAAQTIAGERSTAGASNEVNVTEAARAAVDATLADAELRAASMKFEVGPPPLNLSRGRSGGS
jgi:hypothetical protein